MLKRITNALNYYRHIGARQFALEVVRRLLRLPPPVNTLEQAKQAAVHLIEEEHGRTIAFGPFRGMELSADVWWDRHDQITKVLGVYEKEVAEKLSEFASAQGRTVFIDIGAADGFYAVGMAFSGLAEHVYAFEISQDGQRVIAENARVNGCSDKVTVFGEAREDQLLELAFKNRNGMVLVDIEGAEFDLLSDRVLDAFKTSTFIVELHPDYVDESEAAVADLVSRAEKRFHASFIERGPYDPNRFDLLADLSDDERLLTFSEGRSRRPSWLLLEPFEGDPNNPVA